VRKHKILAHSEYNLEEELMMDLSFAGLKSLGKEHKKILNS
jgi:hypothetical protein